MNEPKQGVPGLSDEQLQALRDHLERAVARYCPRWLADDREDIVQSALLRLMQTWKNAERSDTPDHGYLAKVAFTAIAGEIRQRRRQREVPMDETRELPEPNPGRAPAARAAAVELGRAARECLRGLSETRRMAVILHLYGYRRGEIADVLDWNERQVDNNQHRGMTDLRRCLEAKGFKQ